MLYVRLRNEADVKAFVSGVCWLCAVARFVFFFFIFCAWVYLIVNNFICWLRNLYLSLPYKLKTTL